MTQSYAIAVPFKYRNDSVNDIAAEFNIKYFTSKNKLEDLIAFIKEYEDRTINIEFPEGVHIPTLQSIVSVFDNVKVRLSLSDVMSVKDLKENNIKFFFDPGSILVSDFCELASFIDMGVSDVYLGNDLVYNMKDVHDICESHGVKIRCTLNKIPMTTPGKNTDPKSMVYRPQDIDILAAYYDVFEFYFEDKYDWAKHNVLYRVFFEQKKWNGEISELNSDVEFPYNDKLVFPYITEYKVNCSRHCDRRANAKCDRCGNIINIQKTLAEKGLKIKPE